MSNYATKSDFKNATGVDTSQFDKNENLVKLTSDIDKLDIDELNGLNSQVNTINVNKFQSVAIAQWAFTCSKLTIETLEQGVKYVQS